LSGGSYVQSTAVNLPAGVYPSEPYGIAVDGAGNLYLTDVSNKRVLKETLSGGAYTGTTVPTTGLNASDGIAVDGNGNIYIADTFNNRVVEETLNGGTYTQSTVAAGLSYPYGVAVDGSGNLYIADTLNNRVLRQNPLGNSQSMVGSGLTYPYGVAVDANGKVYIADSGNHRALKEDFSTAPTLAFAAAGQGSTSTDSPQTVTISNLGNTALVSLPVTYPADFPENQSVVDDCSANTSLATGGTCTLTIDFSPVAAGKSNGTVLLREDVSVAGSSNILVPVSGVELLPQSAAVAPVISPQGGTYSAQQSVRLTDATGGATIYYTTNGSIPTASSTKYTGAISISQTTTINAIAEASGYTASPVASATYAIAFPSAATPVFSPKAGTFSTSQSVTITDATKGAVIYYTANGATPTASSTKYSGAIKVAGTETIQAIAVASGESNSAVASAEYTIQ